MEILKPILTFVAVMALMGCGDTTTIVNYVETDTYISSTDNTNHADSTSLNVSKSADLEERIIVKLPTGKGETNSNLEDILKNPITIPLLPFLLLTAILADILNCKGIALTAANLSSASLVFDISSSAETSLTNKLNLNLLSRPWWQSTNWLNAHTFSTQGKWSTPGGDINSSFTTVASTQTGNTVTFDLTTYFKSILAQTDPVHYGVLIQATSSTLNAVKLLSVQTTSTTQRPRVVSTYNCIRTSVLSLSSMMYLDQTEPQPFTYFLGQ
jgi:hypothetical protein